MSSSQSNSSNSHSHYSHNLHPKTVGESIDFGFELPTLGVKVNTLSLSSRKHLTSEQELPENFKYNPEQLTATRDQGKCGSCWAFALTSVIADIIKIKHNISVAISPQNLLNCYGKSCDGADVEEALTNIPKNAYIPEYISPYLEGNAESKFGKCIQSDEQGFHDTVTHSSYRIEGSGRDLIRNMKAHIYHDGPIIGAMLKVYPDFGRYDGVSVYEPQPKQKSMGGHAIEIIGWGKNPDGVEYWICRNSWGKSWPASHAKGEGVGWFYVKMGVNASGIEEVAYACLPEFKGVIASDAPITPDDEFDSERKQASLINSDLPENSPPSVPSVPVPPSVPSTPSIPTPPSVSPPHINPPLQPPQIIPKSNYRKNFLLFLLLLSILVILFKVVQQK